MNKIPLISVIVPIYNGKRYLEPTLESVISQTYLNWELILIDNGSTDNSSKIIKSFMAMDNRIISINLNENSGGPAYPRNLGIEKARGDYVAFLDADDVWDIDKLKNQVDFIIKEGLDVVHGKAEYMDASGNLNGTLKSSKISAVLASLFGDAPALMLVNPIVLSSCLVKNSTNLRFRTDPTFQSIEDWFLWIDLSLSGAKFGRLNKRVVFYRVHDSSLSNLNGKLQYFKGFCLYSTLLLEEKINLRKFLIFTAVHSIRVVKYKMFGRH